MSADLPAPGDRIVGRTFDAPDWRGVDLTDVVFEGCSLVEADLGEALLAASRFVDCRLSAARFVRADAREAVFEGCALDDPETQRGAGFAHARLDEARFVRCRLGQARFEGADLYAARFEDCNLVGARFARARFHRAFGPKVVRVAGDLIGCNLELADLAGLNLAGCRLEGSRLREADLAGADLTGANLRDCDLFQASLEGARLDGADLCGAEVSGLDLRRLASYRNLKIAADQQWRLLDALGVDVRPE